MGDPAFWWYDIGGATFTTVTIPNLIRCERQQFRSVVDAEGWSVSRHDRGGGQLIRIVSRLNATDHASETRKLQTMDSHLRSGGRVAFAGDAGIAFCAPTIQPAYAGDTNLVCDLTVIPWGVSSLSSGDEILIQTLNPLHYERAALSLNTTVTGTTVVLTLSTGLVRDVPEGSMIRQFRTFPTLYLDAAAASSPDRWLSDDRYPGRIWDLDISLTELPYEVAALAGTGQLADGTTRRDMGGLTLESQITQGLKEQPRGLDLGQLNRSWQGWR